MAKIREDLTGAVHVGGVVLFAGDEVPAGVQVGRWVTSDAPADGVDLSTAHVSTVETDVGAEGKNRKTVLDAAAKQLAGVDRADA